VTKFILDNEIHLQHAIAIVYGLNVVIALKSSHLDLGVNHTYCYSTLYEPE